MCVCVCACTHVLQLGTRGTRVLYLWEVQNSVYWDSYLSMDTAVLILLLSFLQLYIYFTKSRSIKTAVFVKSQESKRPRGRNFFDTCLTLDHRFHNKFKNLAKFTRFSINLNPEMYSFPVSNGTF